MLFNVASLFGFWSIYSIQSQRNKKWIILKIKPYFSGLQRKEKEKIFSRKWFSVKIKIKNGFHFLLMFRCRLMIDDSEMVEFKCEFTWKKREQSKIQVNDHKIRLLIIS